MLVTLRAKGLGSVYNVIRQLRHKTNIVTLVLVN